MEHILAGFIVGAVFASVVSFAVFSVAQRVKFHEIARLIEESDRLREDMHALQQDVLELERGHHDERDDADWWKQQ